MMLSIQVSHSALGSCPRNCGLGLSYNVSRTASSDMFLAHGTRAGLGMDSSKILVTLM